MPSNRTSSIVARVFCAWLAVASLVLIIAGTASASPRAHCVKMGHVAANLQDVGAPDFRATLNAGEDATLPGDPISYSDFSAYTLRGTGVQEFMCTARGGVDQWELWRTRSGRALATFDGVTFHAARNVVVAAWKG